MAGTVPNMIASSIYVWAGGVMEVTPGVPVCWSVFFLCFIRVIPVNVDPLSSVNHYCGSVLSDHAVFLVVGELRRLRPRCMQEWHQEIHMEIDQEGPQVFH